MAKIDEQDEGSVKGLSEALKEATNPASLIARSIGEMVLQSERLNNSFLAGKSRMDEMMDSVAKSAAGIVRLGGNMGDVSKTINAIADGSRRNVIVAEEQVTKLYAASSILNIETKALVENFAEVGISVSQIGENLEESIHYIQSIGLNAKDIMVDVNANMEMMNRFNFNNGVQGLTKMAAQASMLRFDMKQTKEFADKVIDPEKAIATAAGFQRLGISVGNLVDPFALMNDSINNPGALQDSIIKATKQFAEFDEKTKTFKINPQGILMLKEMSDLTGIRAEELSKTAIAAMDLDKRISAISPSLQFDKPEDKEFLANMASMKDGEYVVKLRDEKGGYDFKNLSDVTKEEFELLRKQQEETQLPLEEIQISQLDVLKNIETTLRGNVSKATFGVAGSTTVRGGISNVLKTIRTATKKTDEMVPESSKLFEPADRIFNKIKELYTKKDLGNISEIDFSKKLTDLKNELTDKVKNPTEYIDKALEKIKSGNISFGNFMENFKEQISPLKNETTTSNASNTVTGTSNVSPLTYSQFSGINPTKMGDETKSKTENINSRIDFGGTITIKVDAPPGVSQQEFKTYFESEEFKKKIYSYYNQKAKELETK